MANTAIKIGVGAAILWLLWPKKKAEASDVQTAPPPQSGVYITGAETIAPGKKRGVITLPEVLVTDDEVVTGTEGLREPSKADIAWFDWKRDKMSGLAAMEQNLTSKSFDKYVGQKGYVI